MAFAREKEAKVAFKISIRVKCCPCIFPHELHDSNEIQSLTRPSALTINTLSQAHTHTCTYVENVDIGRGTELSLCFIRITPISQYKQKHGEHYNTEYKVNVKVFILLCRVSVCSRWHFKIHKHTHTIYSSFFPFSQFLSLSFPTVHFFGKKYFVAVDWRSFDFLSSTFLVLFEFNSNDDCDAPSFFHRRHHVTFPSVVNICIRPNTDAHTERDCIQ